MFFFFCIRCTKDKTPKSLEFPSYDNSIGNWAGCHEAFIDCEFESDNNEYST